MIEMKVGKFKLNKKIVLISLTAFLFLLIIFINPFTLARYVYNAVKDFFLETQDFYFNCDKMSVNNSVYQIDNWDGVGDFDITFNMNSISNNIVVSKSDISYGIEYTCSSNITCTPSKNTGVIDTTDNRDYFIMNMHPNVALEEGDSVWLEISATSTEPYVQTISGKITLNVGIPGLTYEIKDESNRPYLYFSLTNTLDYYKVINAYGTHELGEEISKTTYLALPDSEKPNYASALITLRFDPNIVVLDMTSEAYLEAVSYTTEQINGYDYLNSVTFRAEPISSEMIRFYKINDSVDYTYPFVNSSSIIEFIVN